MKEFLKAFSSAGASDAYKYLGAFSEKGKTLFRVWAPNAAAVSVVVLLGVFLLTRVVGKIFSDDD